MIRVLAVGCLLALVVVGLIGVLAVGPGPMALGTLLVVCLAIRGGHHPVRSMARRLVRRRRAR